MMQQSLQWHENNNHCTVCNDCEPGMTRQSAKKIKYWINRIPYCLNRSRSDKTISCPDNYRATWKPFHPRHAQYLLEGNPNLLLRYRLCQYLLRFASPFSHTKDCITLWKDIKIEIRNCRSAMKMNYRLIGRLHCCKTTAVTALTGELINYHGWSGMTLNYHERSTKTRNYFCTAWTATSEVKAVKVTLTFC